MSGGYWAFTSYGWTWVSDYSWGWAPFHYGRWWYDSFYGWFWVPDNTWGPAWVIWRTSPGYYGWAPLGPNISITFAMGGGYVPPIDYWCYTSSQYMGRQDMNNYYGPRKNTSDFIATSTVVNNTFTDNKTQTTYIAGPKQDEVEKATGRTIKPMPVKEHTKPAQELENNTLRLYRPTISKEDSDKAKPTKISDKNNIRPAAERTNTLPVQKDNRSVQPSGKMDKVKPDQKELPTPKSGKQNRTAIENKNSQRAQEQPKQPVLPVEQKNLEQQPPAQRQIAQPEKPAPVSQPIPKQETQKAVAPSEHQIDRPVPPLMEKQAPPPPVQPPVVLPRMENPAPVSPVPQQSRPAPGKPR